MDMLPTPEQVQIEEAIGGFLADRLPPSRLSSPVNGDAAAWQEMAGLGIFGISLPEDQGGSGLGIPEEVLVARELGRNLVSPRVLATSFAARLAAHAGRADLATALASGEKTAGFVISDPSVAGAGELLAIDHVDGDMLVSAEGSRLVLRAPATATPRALGALDNATNLVVIEPGKAEIELAENGGDLSLALSLQLSAAMAGIAEATCALSVAYAKERVQFGQPIGAFQAIKHKCADMAVRSTVAWSQTVFAALTLRDGGNDAAMQVASARFLARRAALTNASETIQAHGGIGFTHEHVAHRFLKRAHLLAQLAGNSRGDLEAVIAAPRAA